MKTHAAIAFAVTAAGFVPGCVFADTPGAADFNPNHLPFTAGVYHCELNRTVQVLKVAADLRTAVLSWDKHHHTMHAVTARSGALRYEDADSGLVWLIIPGKSMLLDSKHGKQLANECKG